MDDKAHLRRRLAEKRRYMLDQGYVNDMFLTVEDLGGPDDPDFLENLIIGYVSSTSKYIQKLENNLEKTPVNYAELEYLIMKLKGSSASIGADNLLVAINKLLSNFKRDRRDIPRLRVELERVKSHYFALKPQFQSYVQLLVQLKVDNEEDDRESVGSNNV